jgi:hypothetical protein
MQRVRIIGAMLVAIMAIGAATASAAEFKPGTKGTTFTGSAAKTSTLETKAKSKITCATATASGELAGPTTGTMTINFKGCKALGFPALTTGAAAEEIVIANAGLETCDASKEAAVAVTLKTAAEIKVPAVGTTLAVTGSVGGKLTPVGKKQTGPFELVFTQKGGVSSIASCEQGGKTKSLLLLTSTNGGTGEESGEEAHAEKITFSAAKEVVA